MGGNVAYMFRLGSWCFGNWAAGTCSTTGYPQCEFSVNYFVSRTRYPLRIPWGLDECGDEGDVGRVCRIRLGSKIPFLWYSVELVHQGSTQVEVDWG